MLTAFRKKTIDAMGVKLNASFAGCGFIGIYHVGVCSCLLEHAPHLLQDRVSGTSAGALVSLALVAGIPLPEMAERVLRIASVIRQRTLGPLSPTADLAKLMYQVIILLMMTIFFVIMMMILT